MNSSAPSLETTITSVNDETNSAQPNSGVSNTLFSAPVPPSNTLADSALDSVFLAQALSSNTVAEANPINQNVVDPMFTAPEIPALPSNTLTDAILNVNPINQNVMDPMITAPEIPALPSNTLADATPNVNPINQNVVDPMFSAQEIPALPSNTLADEIPNVNPMNQNVMEPMFTAPEIPALPSNTLADEIPNVNPINQNKVDPMFTSPEIPALPSNALADTIPNVNPINKNMVDPMFTAPEIPRSNTLGDANQGIQPMMEEKTNAAVSMSSPERPAYNPINSTNQVVQTDSQGNTFTILDGLSYNEGSMGADTMKPTVKEPSSSAMLKNTSTERITGAILFPGNWDETKQKNYQSLDLVNHRNNSSIGQALDDSLLEPVENTINSELIKPVEGTLNLETVNATPVLSAQISNGIPTIQAEVQNLNDTGTAAGSISAESITNSSSNIAINTDIGTRLSSKTVIGTLENKVDTLVNNVIDNADMTSADQVSSTGKMDATPVKTDSSLISVPLLRSKINLNSNNRSGNSMNELSSDNDFLTALKGILPVITQNLNKTETDKITETNVTETVVKSNQSSLSLETGSQLFSNSRPENIVDSNQSSGTLDTESQLVPNQRTGETIESNQSNGNIQTGSQLLSISRAENAVESNQSSGTLEAGSQLFSSPRKSFNIDSMNSDMGSVGRNVLTSNEMDSLSSFKKSGPGAVLSTSTVSSSDSTISQEKTSGLVTDTAPTKKVADSIINSFLQDGLLRLSDEVKQQSTESFARTQSVTITTTKPEISTSSNKVTATVDSFVRNNGVPASASSIDIKTVRIEDQPPQELSSISVVSKARSSDETTSSRPEESTISAGSSASTEGHGEPTAVPTPEPTSSTSLPLTERLSINMSINPLAASLSIRNDKQADVTTTTTVTGLSVTTDISIQTDTAANSTQTTAAVKPTAGVLSVNSGVDTKADMMVTEFPTDLFNAAIANPDAFAPRVISGLVTETIEPPMPEPIPDFPTDLTMSKVDLNVDQDLMQTIDSDLAFTIVRLLKNLTDQSALQTTSKSELNDTSAETTAADAAMLDNLNSHQINKTKGTGDIAIVRNAESANTDFETAIIAEIPEGDNKIKANGQIDNETSVNDTIITTSETKTANTTKVVSDTNIQTEIKDNITEPSDTYQKPMLNDVIGDKTQTTPKTVQTTKKAYSVVVDTETDKQFESNIISNEADTSFSSLEDDPDLFGIDRQTLSKYCIIILTYERFISTDI